MKNAVRPQEQNTEENCATTTTHRQSVLWLHTGKVCCDYTQAKCATTHRQSVQIIVLYYTQAKCANYSKAKCAGKVCYYTQAKCATSTTHKVCCDYTQAKRAPLWLHTGKACWLTHRHSVMWLHKVGNRVLSDGDSHTVLTNQGLAVSISGLTKDLL